MERLKIRYLALILLLSGCQILEVTNDESIELIPDLTKPKNEETIESNQLVEVANIEPSVPEIISIWEVLKNEAVIKDDTLLKAVYNCTNISERHRHRYEVNPKYETLLNGAGLIFSALSPDGLLPEAIELPDHPWFIGVQFHPELKSKPFQPHPLFSSFVEAAMKKSRLV